MAAVGRIVRFATGHGCAIIFRRDGVKFFKPPILAPGAATTPTPIN
jgi:hypothetical protein